MACGRRLLRPVRLPVPPHPQVNEPPAHTRRAGGSLGSCSRPRLRPIGACGLEARLAANVELHDLGRPRRLRPRHDTDQMPGHLVLLSVSKGARRALARQRAPRAKSEMSCGVAVSKPTTSSIPWSVGSAIEKPFETMPTTTGRASIPDARR